MVKPQRPSFITPASLQRRHLHARRAVARVLDVDAPRLAAHRAVLDVRLVRAAPGVERDLVLLAAVWADHDAGEVRRAVAEREVSVEIGTVPVAAAAHPLVAPRVMRLSF